MSENEQPQQTPPGGEFMIQKIYIKDISFESPQAPDVFSKDWSPEINLQLNSVSKPIADHVQEVVLTVTVTAKLERKTVFLVEVQQAGIFSIKGFREQEQAHLVGSYCPNILFPFAREVIADVVGKGGFPQFLLAPINFDALYAQHLAQREQQQDSPVEDQQEPMH